MTEGRTWIIELPPGTTVLTANDRMNRYAANKVRQPLRLAVALKARQQKIPALERIQVVVEYTPPPRLKKDRHPLASSRIEDEDNLAPTAKTCVDGLVLAKVLPGDSVKRVRSQCHLLTSTCPMGQLRIIITEVTGELPVRDTFPGTRRDLA